MANKGVTQKNKISTKRILFIILIALLFISTGFVLLGGRDGKQDVYIESAGTHGPQSGRQVITGNLTIRALDVTLINTDVSGDLFLSPEIVGDNLTLKNVTISGNLIIVGDIKRVVLEDTFVEALYFKGSVEDITTILARGKTLVKETRLESGAKLVEENITSVSVEGFRDLIVGTEQEIEADAYFGKILVESKNANFMFLRGQAMLLEIGEEAEDALVTIMDEVQVESLIINSRAVITGKGTVYKAIINVNSVTLEQSPLEIILAEGVTVSMIEQEEEWPVDSSVNIFTSRYDTENQTVVLTWNVADDPNVRYFIFRIDQDQDIGFQVVVGKQFTDNHDFIVDSTYTYILIAILSDSGYSTPLRTTVYIPEPEPEPDPEPEPEPQEPTPAPSPAPEPEPTPDPENGDNGEENENGDPDDRNGGNGEDDNGNGDTGNGDEDNGEAGNGNGENNGEEE